MIFEKVRKKRNFGVSALRLISWSDGFEVLSGL